MTSPTYEIPGEMRDFAEKSVDQARKAFEGFVGAAQKAAGQADESAASMTTNVRAVGSKAMGYAETNIRAASTSAVMSAIVAWIIWKSPIRLLN